MAQSTKIFAWIGFVCLLCGLCYGFSLDVRAAPGAMAAPVMPHLQTTGGIHGTVVAFTVKEIRLSLLAADNTPVASQTVSGREGAYAFDDLAPGMYYLGVQLVDFQDAVFKSMGRNNLVVTAGAITTADVWDWFNPALGVIAGVVAAQDGTPLVGIRVEALSATYNSSTSTNSGGAYQLSNLQPGVYTLRFSDPTGRYIYEYYDNQAGENDALPLTIGAGTLLKQRDATLSLGGAISGKVSLVDGNTLERIDVRVYRRHGAQWELVPARSSGNFVVSGLSDGQYRLEVFGYLPQPDHPYNNYHEYYRNALTLERATDIQVTAGMTVANLDIQVGDELAAVLINGPSAGNVDMDYSFTAQTSPVYAGLPITYTWYPDDPATARVVTHHSGITDTVLFRWSSPGVKAVRVVADNGQGQVTSNRYQVTIDATTGLALELVDVLGGDLRAVASNGPYLYRGQGVKLTAVDLSSPNNPTVLGESAPFSDRVSDLAYAAGYLYVAAGSAGVHVVDVSSPSSLRDVGQYTALTAATQIALSDHYAFVLDEHAGLVVLDMANPAQPTRVGALADFTGTELLLDGQLAVIVATNIALVDISNPASPVWISNYQSGTQGGVAVRDGYLYLSDQTTCRIVSLKAPQTPTVVGTCGNAWGELKINGRYLYTTGFSTYLGYQGGVWVYDLANPVAPAYVTRYVEVAGRLTNLYTTDAWMVASASSQGMVVIAVANQARPFIAGSLSSLAGTGGQIAIQGNYAYVLDDALHTLDLTQPNQVIEVSRLPGFGWGYSNQRLVVNGNTALLVNGARLQLFDLTNPRQPKPRALFEAAEWIDDVALVGTYSYLLVDQQALQVLDLSNLDALTAVATLDINTPAQFLAVQGQYAYLGGNDALQIVQVTNPLTPILVANLPNITYLDAVRVDGTRLYTLERTQRWSNSRRYLTMYDLANPGAPTLLGKYGPDSFQSLMVEQQRAYLTTDQDQLHVVDVSNPAAALGLGKATVAGVKTIALRPPYLYAASDTLGVAVLWLRAAQKNTITANQPMTFAPTAAIRYELPADAWQLATAAAPAAVKLIHTQAYAAILSTVENRMMVGNPYLLQAVDAGSGQAVLAAKPYGVQVQYDAETAAAVDEATLMLFYQDNGQWRAAEGLALDPTQRLVSARLPNLTSWALFATLKPGAPGRQLFLPLIARAAPDFKIAHLELTQAIQSLNNSVPLVAGRPALVRLYATTDSGVAVNGFQLTLAATRDGVALPGSPLTVGPWAIFPQAARDKLGNTFNLLLPSPWTQGKIRLTATLQPPAGQIDSNPANNQTTLDLTFHDVPPLDVKLVPIKYTHEPTGQSYAAPTQEQFSDYVMRLYPIHALKISTRTAIEFTGDLSTDQGWSTLIQLIGTVKKGDNAPQAQIYYGLLSNVDFQSKWGGMGSGGRFSVSFNNGGVVAHEMGHNLGRAHAPCGNPGGVDPDYPYAKASIGEYGLDLFTFTLLPPDTTVDMMSYCGPEWVSDYTYRGLFANQRTYGVQAAGLPVSPTLLVRATVIDENKALFQPLYIYPGAPTALPTSSAFTVTLLGVENNILAEHPVPLETVEEAGFVAHFVNTLLPAPTQPVHRIQLRYQDQVIAERTLLTASVQAAATYQLEQRDTELLLHWQPIDQPALVRYTNDNGQSWLTLALDATGGELLIDPVTLPGGTGRFEIIPADLSQPLLMAASTAPTITLPNQPPKAWITGPTTVHPNAPLNLFGYGDDPEDGALESWQWTVNGAPVAAGQILQLPDIGLVDPVVTLTVTDHAGQQTTATHQVAIQP